MIHTILGYLFLSGTKPPIVGGVPQGGGTRRPAVRVQQMRQVVQTQAAPAEASVGALAGQTLLLQGEVDKCLRDSYICILYILLLRPTLIS